MITQKKITIKDLNSYNELLKYIDKEFIDETVVDYLKSGLADKCKEILIESPYYDRDYLSSYYIYYVKKHKEFSKKCVRLIFLSNNKKEPLIGYLTLRPTFRETHIGRTFVSPFNLMDNDAYLILSNTKMHFFGGEAQISIFPQIGQECDASVCAHVSSWSVLRHYSNRFSKYSEVALGELFDLRGDIHAPRLLLSSGLTPIQIADLFAQNGFSPTILYESSYSSNNSLIKELREEIVAYIESGVPIVGVVEKNKHAVAIVGRGEERKEIVDNLGNLGNLYNLNFYERLDGQQLNIISSTHFIDNIYVNDDHYFPYQCIDIVSKIDAKFKHYTLSDIKCAIVPLHPEINLTYSEVKSKFLMFYREGHKEYGWDEPNIFKIYLSSANTFKQHVYDCDDTLDPQFVNIIETLEYPRFIWCVEISSFDSYKNNLVDQLVIVDSTSSYVDSEPWLLYTAKKKVYYYDAKKIKDKPMSCDKLGMKAFYQNLEHVEGK